MHVLLLIRFDLLRSCAKNRKIRFSYHLILEIDDFDLIFLQLSRVDEIVCKERLKSKIEAGDLNASVEQHLVDNWYG